ncbi:hypothetical protein COU88_01615, partial [Candidatus Roizmanbacteria bacterium CG10_big_fil_rev_8_21_14_0_10_39_6]
MSCIQIFPSSCRDRERERESKLARWFSKTFFFVLFLLLGFNQVVSPVFAATLTGISYSPSGSVVGTFVAANNTTFTVFTPITAVTSGSTITLTFPSGTTLTTGNIATTDFTITQAAQGLCTSAGSDTTPSAISANATNRTITLTAASGSLSRTVALAACGLGVITIKTSGTAGGNEIQHPTTTTTTATFQVDTSVGDTGSISTVSFVPAAAANLRVTGTGTMTVATTNELTVTAYDQYGNTVSSGANNYTGSKSLTLSGPGNAPNGTQPTVEGTNIGSATSITFTNGVSNANAATLTAYKAETTTVDVSDGSINSTGDASYDLDLTASPGALNDFTLTTQNSQTETAGTAFNVTATARDAQQNTKTDYSGATSVVWTWTATTSPDGSSPSKPSDGDETFTSGAMTKSGFTLVDAGE